MGHILERTAPAATRAEPEDPRWLEDGRFPLDWNGPVGRALPCPGRTGADGDDEPDASPPVCPDEEPSRDQQRIRR